MAPDKSLEADALYADAVVCNEQTNNNPRADDIATEFSLSASHPPSRWYIVPWTGDHWIKAGDHDIRENGKLV